MACPRIVTITDWLGSNKRIGNELGPEALEAEVTARFCGSFPKPAIRIPCAKPAPDSATGEYEKIKYLPELLGMLAQSQAGVAQVLGDGEVPLVLMGDDSSVISVLSAIAKRHGNDYCLAYIDAHGDFNTPEISPTGLVYGMPLAHLCGFGDCRLTAFNGGKPALKPSNIAMLGQRSLDEEEAEFIKGRKILLMDAGEVNASAAEKVVDRVISAFKKSGSTGTYIHIDLDSLDPLESPGSLMHEPDGIRAKKLLETVALLLEKSDRVLGMTISEYNPKTDAEGKTRAIVFELVRLFLERTGKN